MKFLCGFCRKVLSALEILVPVFVIGVGRELHAKSASFYPPRLQFPMVVAPIRVLTQYIGAYFPSFLVPVIRVLFIGIL